MPCNPSFNKNNSSNSSGSSNTGGSAASSSSCGSVSFPIPSSGAAGFPFSIPVSPIPFPANFPEDLLCLLDFTQLLVPSGPLYPQLSLNSGKDVFDAIMKLMDQFMPFLMLYKFFLPVLNLIICIIEVLCALMNPFALVGALDRLFTQCIPAFLSLFPVFALVIMIISLLLLLLSLIEYIIEKIIDLTVALLKNINALNTAFEVGNSVGVLAIANKLASLLCIFQNIFVLLSLFGVIINVIKDILGMLFSIPPCEGGGDSNCCGSLTCPQIVQGSLTSNVGVLQYVNEVSAPIPGFSLPGFSQPTVDLRIESWQIYDNSQISPKRFWDIVKAQDVINDGHNPPPVYFPTGSNFSDTTPVDQAAYTVNIRLLYKPSDFGRVGPSQYIRFNNCIVLKAPTQNLLNGQNNNVNVSNGVLYIVGGQGVLDDNTTILNGFMPDGITPITPPVQATLENFLHRPQVISGSPILDNGVTYQDVTYTFNPNTAILMQANLVTAGCQPQVMFSRAFVNNTLFANVATQTSALQNLQFPDPTGAQECMLAALSSLRANMTSGGVSQFQTMMSLCLDNLQNDTKGALSSVIGIGFSPCNSNFSLDSNTQFTTLPITVNVNLNESNNLPLTKNLPADIAATFAQQIVAYPTFGEVGNFTYDGYQSFNAQLTSHTSGSGSIMVAFQNQVLCNNNLPTTGTPSHTLQSLDYQFIYTPSTGQGGGGLTDINNSGGEVRRDRTDVSKEEN